jgi:F0F1-type ATP synthase membrane subunit b/b'
VSPTPLIPSLQADALAREIEQQLKEETGAAREAAEREAQATVARARKTARGRLQQAIRQIRREGERRLIQARAQLETQARAAQQQEAAHAVTNAMPLLHKAMAARWKDTEARQRWVESVAKLCAIRLRPGQWTITHPADWSVSDQKAFTRLLGGNIKVELIFKADKKLIAGLKVASNQAVLDATLEGLLADERTIEGLVLQALDEGAGT